MKVSAHPLMVAVALGLLSPSVLSSDRLDKEAERRAERRAVSPASESVAMSEVVQALESAEGPRWGQLTLHDTDGAELWSEPTST
ncbi:MAG: hypothetical protein EA397_19900 [Deltaproteobacteria bacterium]|nr:MAG: hypothetical protein EA397_19900 [Deltaproteobacteria bacterium]